MAAAAEVQNLLRFLSQDAKISLAVALPKVGELRKASLNSAENIAKSTLSNIQLVFPDEKLARQVLNAAKRVTNPKKRAAPSTTSTSPAAKRRRGSGAGDSHDDLSRDVEAELALPTTMIEENELRGITLQTNRAPLVLAFAVTLIKYTMPEQPLSSRLSLAQAVVSANSRSKARSIGLENGTSAEDEGWGKGQPKVRVMGREIAVMRRGGYAPSEAAVKEDSEKTVGTDTTPDQGQMAYWGLDLEALRKSNGPLVAGKNATGQTGLPIYPAQAARSYLLRSFAVIEPEIESAPAKPTTLALPGKKKLTASQTATKREEAVAMLLRALDVLYESWAEVLGKDELDRRAWSWYLHVRPDVAQGQAGWGQKGLVRLEDILGLKRRST